MAKPPKSVTIELPDTRNFEKQLRAIARHADALAEELEEIRLTPPVEA